MAQVVIKAWNSCTLGAGLGSIVTALQPYSFYNSYKLIFKGIGSREAGYALKWQRSCYAGSNRVVLPSETRDGAEAQEALECRKAADKSKRYITSAMPNTLHTAVETGQLYVLKDL